MNNPSHRPFFLWLLIILLAILGFGAVLCGLMLMIAPDGSLIQLSPTLMQGSPFANYFFPGLVLFLFVGVFPLCISYGLWKKPSWTWPDAINPFKAMHWAWTGSVAAGVILILWLGVELIWVDYFALHTIMFTWSGIILLLTLLPPVMRFFRRK